MYRCTMRCVPIYHCTCVVFPGRQGELALKAVEFVQTGMPMTAASAAGAYIRPFPAQPENILWDVVVDTVTETAQAELKSGRV